MKNKQIFTPIENKIGQLDMKTTEVYTTAYTRGGLKETLETEQPITREAAQILILSLYDFYAYDERIKAKRYIIKDMEDNLGLPTWIHEYEIEIIEENGKHNPANI